MAPAPLQTAAALGALALEDEAHQASVVALADLVEADRARPAGSVAAGASPVAWPLPACALV
jgi:hypothetical protein